MFFNGFSSFSPLISFPFEKLICFVVIHALKLSRHFLRAWSHLFFLLLSRLINTSISDSGLYHFSTTVLMIIMIKPMKRNTTILDFCQQRDGIHSAAFNLIIFHIVRSFFFHPNFFFFLFAITHTHARAFTPVVYCILNVCRWEWRIRS